MNIYQLAVLTNIENLNAEYIRTGFDARRLSRLNRRAIDQKEILLRCKSLFERIDPPDQQALGDSLK